MGLGSGVRGVCGCAGGLLAGSSLAADASPPNPSHGCARREGHAKLFMMPLSSKKRAQNQVGGAKLLLT